MSTFHCAAALVDGHFAADVRVEVDDGVIVDLSADSAPTAEDVSLGTVVPGFVNAHSHAFHRALRGRTHDAGGDFWRWRTRMYEEAAGLTPDGYRTLATRVFTEMRDAGCTTVSEFHYVHHRSDGTSYPHHDMELAVAEAAASVGIRLLLLDTLYLRGGPGVPLAAEQLRFGDHDVHGWLARWHGLRDALGALASPLVSLGAAVHSVRAVAPADLVAVADGLPSDVPLHVHVSEQPAENEQCIAETGLTPTALLAASGLLSPRLSAVHATHLTPEDIDLLGGAGVTVVMCPTTEADLGDGIGPAPELLAAGARLAIGSDQNAVVDPWEETARLELDQRLRLGRRGVFTPRQLWAAGSGTDGIRVGRPFDALEVASGTPRTAGADPLQLPLVARGEDVTATIVGGRMTRPGVASGGGVSC
ncbi:formimidoylglutamate deiminase [Microbacterium sp.]|uniref:formimidoylglutamate deiminase n=1 Tax=Microbacterium sp. TaxID=51671 RepID=UPI0009291239|nr:formimidoylglutamate deiminase [Microbacterium sp.]MBN9191948.1 formimidoylglutamate deiminase [Microbacterium sp.]OJU61311.1 MAG: formimidoylglutamate deiminase [Microbacterium sp. 70-38]